MHLCRRPAIATFLVALILVGYQRRTARAASVMPRIMTDSVASSKAYAK
ncbi:hypothetical protein Poly51_34670 [Rubripirellula tenax]|uniref:Uncharacterized protein n=1 Tax=Rubripirellula tenax TaxID=2528015 RepID=A0A5C6F041_9BACT|nr:hypothetical protein Poly51_34670 [Rubripirellula tenax]